MKNRKVCKKCNQLKEINDDLDYCKDCVEGFFFGDEDDDVMFDECLNCGSSWGIGSEEYDFQQCDACGWQPGEPTDEDYPDDDDSEFEPIS